jgi:hypothetical protein
MFDDFVHFLQQIVRQTDHDSFGVLQIGHDSRTSKTFQRRLSCPRNTLSISFGQPKLYNFGYTPVMSHKSA